MRAVVADYSDFAGANAVIDADKTLIDRFLRRTEGIALKAQLRGEYSTGELGDFVIGGFLNRDEKSRVVIASANLA